MSTLAHATIVMERTYDASPARVFAAWADVEARKRWSAPADHIRIEYEEADFREGGRDLSRCIEPGNADYTAAVQYIDVSLDQRMVFAEDIKHGGRRVSAALISVELAPSGAGARLLLTMQIAAFEPDMVEGYRFGWTAALDKLAKEFAQ